MGSYEFGVTHQGTLLFWTVPTYTDKKAAGRLLTLLLDKFPAGEGYEVQCICWERSGTLVNIKDLLEG